MSEENAVVGPQSFISYAWPVVAEGDPVDHSDWVLRLAERLVLDGFPVLLDQWDLEPGADKFEFMERSVTDSNVKKVLIICTRRYKERADKRERGVGVESTIMSSEVYKKAEQKKFIPIIREKDEEGNAYMPAFISSRIFIDLSDDTTFEENYERLKNALLDRPISKRPTLGKIASYLLQEEASPRASSTKKHAAQSAYTSGRPTALGQAQDYFETLASEMTAMTNNHREERVVSQLGKLQLEDLEKALPVRDEFIEFIQILLRYAPADTAGQLLSEYFDRSAPVAASKDSYCTSAQILIYEQFLHTVRILVEAEKFNDLNIVLSKTYYDPSEFSRVSLQLYDVFRPRDLDQSAAMRAFAEQETTNWISKIAAFLRQRASSEAQFLNLTEADIILFLRMSLTTPQDQFWTRWWPETLPFLENRLMSRSDTSLQFVGKMRSRHYFERFKVVLGVESLDVYKNRIEEIELYSHLKRINFSTVASLP